MISFKKWCIEKNAISLLELYENGTNIYDSNEIGFSSSKSVNWKCNKCVITWKESLSRVTQRIKKECPYCSHTRASEKYNLIIECPILEQEWNYELNEKLPTQYLPNSNKEVWWKCQNGHEWNTQIYLRTGKHHLDCPYCKHVKASEEYNLITERPDLEHIWDYELNSKKPTQYLPNSNKKV